MGFNGARNSFFEKIGLIMEKEDVYIVSADLAGPPFDRIRKEYPQRYVTVGIAEQNMVSVSVGLALAGKRVIAYTANPFIALRALDQIRNGICMNNALVTVVGVGTGFSISSYGTTHFVTEDVAFMKLCPGIKQITINDNDISDAALNYMLNSDGPLYLRFDKECNDHLLENDKNVDIEMGFRVLKKSDGDVCVIAEGYPVHMICNMYKNEQSFPTIIEVFSHPFDKSRLLETIRDKKRVIVCEEQQKIGGLGSEILEICNAAGINKDIVCMGIDYSKGFPECYGSRKYWLEQFGISEKDIRKNVNSK